MHLFSEVKQCHKSALALALVLLLGAALYPAPLNAQFTFGGEGDLEEEIEEEVEEEVEEQVEEQITDDTTESTEEKVEESVEEEVEEEDDLAEVDIPDWAQPKVPAKKHCGAEVPKPKTVSLRQIQQEEEPTLRWRLNPMVPSLWRWKSAARAR